MIKDELLKLVDEKYQTFSAKLIPNIESNKIVGIRMPVLRDFVKKSHFNHDLFMEQLPHTYHEENIVHILLINQIKDFERALYETSRFLPYMDNWAVTDAMNYNGLEKDRMKMLSVIENWLQSEHPYTVRLAILYLMKAEIDNEKTLKWVSQVTHPDYYVQMMQAWYLCEGMIKAPHLYFPYIENNVFEKWVHNKAIQKCVESFRIDEKLKDNLKSLRR